MENYGLKKTLFYYGKKEFELINTCFQFFGFMGHLIDVYHLWMGVFVFIISYGCYGWQQEIHLFFQRYVFHEQQKKTWKRQNVQRQWPLNNSIYVAPIANVLLRIAKYTTYYSVQVLLLCSKQIAYKALSDKE